MERPIPAAIPISETDPPLSGFEFRSIASLDWGSPRLRATDVSVLRVTIH